MCLPPSLLFSLPVQRFLKLMFPVVILPVPQTQVWRVFFPLPFLRGPFNLCIRTLANFSHGFPPHVFFFAYVFDFRGGPWSSLEGPIRSFFFDFDEKYLPPPPRAYKLFFVKGVFRSSFPSFFSRTFPGQAFLNFRATVSSSLPNSVP